MDREGVVDHELVGTAVDVHLSGLGCVPEPEDRTAFELAARDLAAGRTPRRVAGIPSPASRELLELLRRATNAGVTPDVAVSVWDEHAAGAGVTLPG